MGKRDGKGIKTWPENDGREYIGEWNNNKRTGRVTNYIYIIKK